MFSNYLDFVCIFTLMKSSGCPVITWDQPAIRPQLKSSKLIHRTNNKLNSNLNYHTIANCCGISIIIQIYFQMGCGLSANQVSDNQCEIFRPEKLLEGGGSFSNVDFAQGRVFLFGENKTERRIAQVLLSKMEVKSLSKRTRIPRPKISYDSLELMYEESQEIFTPGFYGFSSLPPFNQMLILFLQQNVLFLCGGVDYDEFNVKNQAFFYQIIDDNTSKSNEKTEETKTKFKFSNNKFERASGMSTKRYGHLGTVYSNQKQKYIFVFGGFDQQNHPISACERYSLLQNEWKSIAPMQRPRANGFCLQFLGRIYIFGGVTGEGKRSKKIQVYSPDQNRWEILNIKLHRGVSSGIIFPIKNNQILIIGGNVSGGSLRSVIKVNIFQQTYVWDSDLTYTRSQQKGLKFKESLYIFGEHESNMCEIFDLDKKIWRSQQLMHTKVLGIDSFSRFSFSTQSLNLEYDSSERKQSQILKNKSKKIIFGTDEYPCIIECNFELGVIQKCQVPMSLRLRSWMGVVKISENEYFLCGGCDFNETKSSKASYIYSIKTKKAVQTVKMLDKKCRSTLVYFDQKVYMFGGYSAVNKKAVRTCECYDIVDRKWTPIASLRHKRYGCTAQLIQNSQLILIIGGYAHESPDMIKQVEIYNIQENKFTVLHDLLPQLHILGWKIKDFTGQTCEIVIFNQISDHNQYQLIGSKLKIKEDEEEKRQKIQTENYIPQVINPNLQKKKAALTTQIQSVNYLQKPSFEQVQVIHPSQVIQTGQNNSQIRLNQQPQEHKRDHSLAALNDLVQADYPQVETNVVRIRPKQRKPSIQDDQCLMTKLNLNQMQSSKIKSEQDQLKEQVTSNNKQMKQSQKKRSIYSKIQELSSKKQQFSSINFRKQIDIPFNPHYLIFKEDNFLYLISNAQCFEINLFGNQTFHKQFFFKKSTLQGLKLSYLSNNYQ